LVYNRYGRRDQIKFLIFDNERNKKFAISIIILIAASIFTIPAIIKDINVKNSDNRGDAEFILYYGNTCPHCVVVEQYIAANNLEQKLKIEQKEVFQNQDNNNELASKAKICGIDTKKLGVPLLWDNADSKCYEGDQEIISFLKQKAQLP